ncbi:hypothetical protein FB382_002498 [Nocardioides ginsengisegetis]|uniref:DUF4230 domain-containing protein n=1 Tax=Nocardioides ginsengisegetis TaxID=661491 RepID=A0A7W3PA90_9ACTN|nr:DUF4230 domain-containing protein [Nocardioides ginsengisegetis]MBA8804207.1 hypothetical protein [Nocardioides ginsengisegetis]
MRFFAKLAAVAVVCMMVIAVGIAAAWKLGVNLPFGVTDVDRSQPAVLKSIQDISEFHAAVGNFEVVLDYEHDVNWVPSFIAGERSLFVAAGTVDAYVDFSGLASGDVRLSDDGKSVVVRLPDAQLSKPNLDQDRTYLFSQDRGVLDRVGDALSTDDQQELYQLAETKLEAAAEESELERQAQDNTQAMLVGLFGSMDMKVTFVS